MQKLIIAAMVATGLTAAAPANAANIVETAQGAGTFEDVTGEYNAIATSPGFGGGHSIGSAWGDFDNDGHIDLFAGNFAHQDGRGDQPKSRWLRNRRITRKTATWTPPIWT